MPTLCNTQTTVERLYFSSMKKHTTWNSVETWSTKIVKNHVFVHWQPSVYSAKPGNERHRSVYWDDCIVVWILRTAWRWCSRTATRHKKQYREFAL